MVVTNQKVRCIADIGTLVELVGIEDLGHADLAGMQKISALIDQLSHEIQRPAHRTGAEFR